MRVGPGGAPLPEFVDVVEERAGRPQLDGEFGVPADAA